VAATRAPRTVDLAALIDERKLSPFNYLLIALSTLVTLFDGLDMMMMSFTAPYMQEELSLSDTQISLAFSAGTAGMVVGGLIFTYIGDRIGRRPTIVFCTLAFGILTFLTGFAPNYEILFALRFLDGLAIGGALPLAWALNVEFVPKRIRATVVAFIMMGFSFGSAAAAPLTNMIGPTYGWEGVYFVGGIGTVICAALIAVYLPESPRFLVTKGIRPEQVVSTLKRLDSNIDVQVTDNFTLADEGQRKDNVPFFKVLGELFEGRLRWLTPIIWIGYGASALGIFFKSAFGPIVLERMDVAREMAANVSALSGVLGAIAGVIIMRLCIRYGLMIAAFATFSIVPLAVSVGMEWIDRDLLLPVIVVQSMLVGGCHAAIISQLALYYPSAIRASAGGFASAIGKLGGVVGPVIGAVILESGMPAVRTYAIAAICPAILAISIVLIYGMTRKPKGELEPRGNVAPAE
jgi:AAHS family 4-hydroxybenzoate transporter-like MFS transporter